MTAVWGVINVTPDSFSDGGRFQSAEDAVRAASYLVAEGADVVDVGGESTRPRGPTYGEGAVPVSAEEELRRVLPVVQRLVQAGVVVSVDTNKGEVASRVLQAGARVINDVTGGRDDALLAAVARHRAELVLMHNRSSGAVDASTTRYDDVVEDVLRELRPRVERALAAGIARDRLWLDPGLGFAKTAEQSLALLARTAELVARAEGLRVLVGASRKSFLAETIRRAGGAPPPPDRRLAPSLVAAVHAARCGAHAVRVHDVGATRQALAMASALDACAGSHRLASRAEGVAAGQGPRP
jgi:dihydropteroate synthase